MAFFRSDVLNNQAEFRTFVFNSFNSAGWAQSLDNTDYLAFKKKNILMTSSIDGFLQAVIIADNTDIGLTTAQDLPALNLIPKNIAPKTNQFNTNFLCDLLITDFSICLSLVNNTTKDKVCFVLATIDYRELDTNELNNHPNLLENYKNNGHIVFEVGNESQGRVLYAGEIGNENIFNQPLVLDTPSFNAAFKLSDQNSSVLPVSTIAVASNNKFLGLLKDVYITKTSAIFYLDKGNDQNGRSHIFFRNTFQDTGVLVSEA